MEISLTAIPDAPVVEAQRISSFPPALIDVALLLDRDVPAASVEAALSEGAGDLLESVAGTPGSFDRTHHHPAFTGWEPGGRVFVRELSQDPIAWLATRLSDLPGVLEEAGVAADVAGPDDAESLRREVPEILGATEELLGKVRRGQAGNPPPATGPGYVRAGWL